MQEHLITNSISRALKDAKIRFWKLLHSHFSFGKYTIQYQTEHLWASEMLLTFSMVRRLTSDCNCTSGFVWSWFLYVSKSRACCWIFASASVSWRFSFAIASSWSRARLLYTRNIQPWTAECNNSVTMSASSSSSCCRQRIRCILKTKASFVNWSQVTKVVITAKSVK